MTGEDGRQGLEAMLPQQDIARRCAPCGVLGRHRQVHRGMLVRAMVRAAGTPAGAYQADSLRSARECAVPRGARSAFSRCCDAPLAQFLTALADRALASARAQPVERAGIWGGVTDWDSVASTTVTRRDALRDEGPGTGD